MPTITTDAQDYMSQYYVGNWASNVTASSAPTQTVWINWNQAQGQAAATGSAQTITFQTVTMDPWTAWNDAYLYFTPQGHYAVGLGQRQAQGQAQLTPEQAEAHRQAALQSAHEAEARRKSAEQKAEELLMLYLTEEQKKSYKEKGYFETATDVRRYRLHRGSHGNIREIDDKGKEVARLCVNCEGVPYSDNVLAQLLALMTDENYLLSRANRTPLC